MNNGCQKPLFDTISALPSLVIGKILDEIADPGRRANRQRHPTALQWQQAGNCMVRDTIISWPMPEGEGRRIHVRLSLKRGAEAETGIVLREANEPEFFCLRITNNGDGKAVILVNMRQEAGVLEKIPSLANTIVAFALHGKGLQMRDAEELNPS